MKFGLAINLTVILLASTAIAAGVNDGHHDEKVEIRELHANHEHGHDFKVMEELSPETQDSIFELFQDIGIAMPPMDSDRGRDLFINKGCIACHSINGVGGEMGPSLNAEDMPSPMNAFEFAARMWRGAVAMTALQEDMFGEVIALDGQELADLIAFAHDLEAQKLLTKDQIPEQYQHFIH